ncbi:MAG: sugar ABC transporter ATP-binding protein [Herbinix sp.]|nr:sugar ABC transporter ATP-binding protein [Herbinix sp.]
MDVLLSTDKICKSFMGNKVLNDISIDIHKGECLALVGENGAGKSTLMKIICGIYKADSGSIRVNGKIVNINRPSEAQDQGIAIIHQELNLIPNLTVAQNIFLGKEKTRGIIIDDKNLNSEAELLAMKLGVKINPDQLVSTLTVAEQQITEIVKVLSQNADIIIMDEPTASLSIEETGQLFEIINELRKSGKGIIYISHRLEEIYKVAQRICVLRDGRLVNTFITEDTQIDAIVKSMVGQSISEFYVKHTYEVGEVAIRVENLSCKKEFYDISFEVREGEVLGIAGLMGAGQTPLARCIYGLDKIDSGSIVIGEKKLKNHLPSISIANSLGLVTENRKEEGLILQMSIKENIGLSPWAPISNQKGIINKKKENDLANHSIEKYDIKANSPHQETVLLSGGNQQKVAIAKVLATNPKVVILCEPTRGVDVNGKVEIYNIMNQLLEQKKAVILISSEIPEILGMSDRIMVIYKGRIVYEAKNIDLKQEDIMAYATGGHQNG